jgi:ribosome maturation protein Sdo1
MTETYANMVSHSVDNTFTAGRLANNMIFANMETFKTSTKQTKENIKEFSRIAVNNAKALEQVAGEYMKSSNQLISERGSVERERERESQKK